MGRSSSSHERGELKKGPWTREEDQKLLAFIEEHGHGSWRALPAKAGLQRCGKSCRLRWANYLRPDIKRGKFTPQEEKAIIRLHALLGNRWSAIATHLPKRTDNEIKNYWNTRLKKRLTRMGIDPATHKPKDNPGDSVVSHMAQWETARLEAEARLGRECKLQLLHKAAARPLSPCLDVLKVWQATFKSQYAATVDSPTSTLNFSMPPTPSENGYYMQTLDHINLPHLLQDSTYYMDYGTAYHDSTTAYLPDFEDNNNYWNDLFNLVTSPL